MPISTVSSREFNQDVSKVKRASLLGPVFITDRGQVAHVLLTIDAYQALTSTKENIVDLLAMPAADDIDFKIPKLTSELYRSEEF
ncbi:MAG: type II toxin-antitoxin system Phd/YefM family antitoxin [Pseudomonadota bacterium]